MNAREAEVLRLFAAEVRRHFPTARIWAFGSRVRGEAREDSDLDVCVVVDELDEAADKAIMRIAWRVGFDHDLLISTVTYSGDEFGRGPLAASPLVRTVREEGVAA